MKKWSLRGVTERSVVEFHKEQNKLEREIYLKNRSHWKPCVCLKLLPRSQA